MDIRVKKIDKVEHGWRITFHDALLARSPSPRHADFEYTDVGARATRILRHICGGNPVTRFSGQYVVLVDWARSTRSFESVEVLQRWMSRLANTRMSVRFKDPVVQPVGYSIVLRSMTRVESWRASGEAIRVSQTLTLNLPTVPRDVVRLKALVPSGKVWTPDDPYMIRLEVPLEGKLEGQNPWKFCRGLKPKIKRVIV